MQVSNGLSQHTETLSPVRDASFALSQIAQWLWIIKGLQIDARMCANKVDLGIKTGEIMLRVPEPLLCLQSYKKGQLDSSNYRQKKALPDGLCGGMSVPCGAM